METTSVILSVWDKSRGKWPFYCCLICNSYVVDSKFEVYEFDFSKDNLLGCSRWITDIILVNLRTNALPNLLGYVEFISKTLDSSM